MKMVYNDGLGMRFMGEYIRGVVVKLHLTLEQEVMFKQNYGCTRKTHNELLNKYKAKYGDSNKIPTKNELNQFLNESKKELPYLMETESTSLQQARDDLHKAFKNSFKSKRHNPPKFHSKKKTRPSFRQTIRKDKRPVEKNTLTLRKHGKVTFSTSVEYLVPRARHRPEPRHGSRSPCRVPCRSKACHARVPQGACRSKGPARFPPYGS